MGVAQIVFGIILILFSIGIIIIVLLQEGSQQNMGTITGGADTFFSKIRRGLLTRFLARWTKFIAVGFFVAVIVINIIMYFL